MKVNFTAFLKSVPWFCLLFSGCVSSLPEVKHGAFFPVSGEKIFICPIIDSSSLDKFDGWPTEKPLQTLLQKNYQQMYQTMAVEFRRGEKYGLYEITEDSIRSTTMISFIIKHYAFKKDSLTLPVRMIIKQGTVKKSFPSVFTAYGIYKARSKPKSPFHYIDILLADFRRNFPYKQVVGVFCPPRGKN
jgi:hypothetical protein